MRVQKVYLTMDGVIRFGVYLDDPEQELTVSQVTALTEIVREDFPDVEIDPYVRTEGLTGVQFDLPQDTGIPAGYAGFSEWMVQRHRHKMSGA